MSSNTHFVRRICGALWRALRGAGRPLRSAMLGRRFLHSLERNREAADRLDLALKEMLGR